MTNLTDTARALLEGKDEKPSFFDKKKKEDGGDDKKKGRFGKADKDDDTDGEDDKGSKLAKCKKLVAAEKDVKEDSGKAANKLKKVYEKKKIDAHESKKEKALTEVDTNNTPDLDNKAMKAFISQWKQLLKMDIGDQVTKNVDGVEILGTITDFVGYDDGQITDVVIEWDQKNEDGSAVEEVVSVKDVEVVEENAKEDFKAKSTHDRKIETNKKNREHGAKKEEVVHEARKLIEIKKKDMKENTVNEDETQAQDSLHPNTHPADDPKAGHDGPSRLALISKMIGASNAMSDDECVSWLTKSLAQIGHEADRDPDTAETNRATLKTYKPDVVVTGEDVAALFDGEELSEEFKTKTSALFEAAVSAKMVIAEDKIEAAFAEVLQEQIDENKETLDKSVTELNEKVEMYLDYVASQWLEENEIAVESALRSEMTASFMKGLKDLFVEHYIDIPEDKVDIVEELSSKNAELEDRFNALLSEKHELEASIREAAADELFNEAASGLATSQVEKFRVLAEDIEYLGNDAKYKEKLAFIREAHFLDGGRRKVKVDFQDSFEAPVALHEDVSPEMLPYVKAISKHVPKTIDPKKLAG